jgi:hypothetical protein
VRRLKGSGPKSIADIKARCIVAPSGCWIWQGGKSNGGYGVFGTNKGPTVRVNRFVLAEKLGRPIRPGYQSLHECSTPPCANPDHLFEGTPGDNMRQRYAEHEDHPRAKLTPATVRHIRESHLAGESTVSIAKRLKESYFTVQNVVTGRTWKRIA